ncbi:MAG: polyprenyl synthetase family protein [Nitrososphaerota archaeon]|nr:polyprenyl synthetase family protein [Nitrososphaerota archaeon]MDG7030295.1 polyprenyl synthetase family protein [Nitrososphaerota archaeon]
MLRSAVQIPDVAWWLRDYVGPVNSALEELCPPGGATPLERAAFDALSVGGKRVRGTLALLWCEMYSGDYRPAINLAVAYELAHASALIQDDIIDRSEMRRGEKSIGAKYGLATALLASDLLLFNVPKMVARYENLESRRLTRVLDLLGEACKATTWGEFIDMEMAGDGETSERRYEEMIRLKTSSLLSAPCASGALVGGASDEEAALAGRFGEEVGMAYQIQDDALDLVGDESDLGKPMFTDMRGGKKSVVLMHCMDRCRSEDKAFIRGLMNRTGAYSKPEIERLGRLIRERGSLAYARKKIEHHTEEAKLVLGPTPEGAVKSRLLELTEYLAARYY